MLEFLQKRLKAETSPQKPVTAKLRLKGPRGGSVSELNLVGWRLPQKVNRRGRLCATLLREDGGKGLQATREAFSKARRRANRNKKGETSMEVDYWDQNIQAWRPAQVTVPSSFLLDEEYYTPYTRRTVAA